MKAIAGFCVFLALCNYVTARTVVIKSAPDPNEPLFENENFIFSKDIKDNKAPTIYTGDVMQAKTKESLNTRTKDKAHYAYGTANGIEVESVGKVKETGDGKKAFIVSGSYSYTGADGKRYRVRYTADEFGYHPKTELELDFPDPDSNNRQARGQVDKPKTTPSKAYLPPVPTKPSLKYLPIKV
ncbi:larval cuticle protein LCP-17 [Culicoides brevitarsis]|uniref:larval cuticle protein LCP-17 n=1 Tax=Culicoides brevitarsis TaxID=469753 RepID=UPI00307BA424